MLKCREVTEKASDWLDGNLGLLERVRIRAHLALCAHCRHFMSGLETTGQLVRSVTPDSQPVSDQLLQRIDAALERRLQSVNGSEQAAAIDNGVEAVNDPLIDSVTEPQDPTVQRVFAEIQEREGMVPNLYRAYAHNPEILEQNWNRVKALMYDGALSPELKQSIATLISRDNQCRYCVVYHSQMLRALGISELSIRSMMDREDYSILPQKDQALLRLAREANRNPHGTTPELVEAARNAGASERELVEALGIMELYSSFNRFLDSLKVPLDNPGA